MTGNISSIRCSFQSINVDYIYRVVPYHTVDKVTHPLGLFSEPSFSKAKEGTQPKYGGFGLLPYRSAFADFRLSRKTAWKLVRGVCVILVIVHGTWFVNRTAEELQQAEEAVRRVHRRRKNDRQLRLSRHHLP